MRFGIILAGFLAVILHGAFILFGGLLLPKARPEQHAVQVEFVPPEEVKKEEQKVVPPEEQKVEEPQDTPPDVAKMEVALIPPSETFAPAIDDISLDRLSHVLDSKGSGDFGGAGGIVSGGQFGGHGTGSKGPADQAVDAFGMADIDQRPRAIFQTAPEYPSEMRGKKTEGVVSVLFVVDATGKVTQQRIERSNQPAFEKPALEAVRRWKFEPGVKAGQRVAAKMRVTIRFAAE